MLNINFITNVPKTINSKEIPNDTWFYGKFHTGYSNISYAGLFLKRKDIIINVAEKSSIWENCSIEIDNYQPVAKVSVNIKEDEIKQFKDIKDGATFTGIIDGNSKGPFLKIFDTIIDFGSNNIWVQEDFLNLTVLKYKDVKLDLQAYL